MIHARPDYDRFQDPLNKIPEDEPVMLFRAQDIHFIKILEHYQHLLKEAGNKEVGDAVAKHEEASRKWRHENKVKEPDL